MKSFCFEPVSTDYILFKKKFEGCVEITQKTTSIPFCAPWDDKYIGNLYEHDLWVCWLSGGTGSYPRVFFSGKIKEKDNKIVVEGFYRYDIKHIVFDVFLMIFASIIGHWILSVAFVLIWSVITLLSNKENKEKIKELLESL